MLKCSGTCSLHKGLSSTKNYKSEVSLHVKLQWKMSAICQSYEAMRSCHSPHVSRSLVTYEHFFCPHLSQFPRLSIEITPVMELQRPSAKPLPSPREASLRWFATALEISKVHQRSSFQPHHYYCESALGFCVGVPASSWWENTHLRDVFPSRSV